MSIRDNLFAPTGGNTWVNITRLPGGALSRCFCYCYQTARSGSRGQRAGSLSRRPQPVFFTEESALKHPPAESCSQKASTVGVEKARRHWCSKKSRKSFAKAIKFLSFLLSDDLNPSIYDQQELCCQEHSAERQCAVGWLDYDWLQVHQGENFHPSQVAFR